jgi:small-conductance mechanosensitive channel
VAMIGPPLWKRLRTLLALSFVWVLTLAPLALAAPVLAADERPAGESQSQSADSEAGALSAPVVIDGRTLFRVRGTSSFSAERRAAGIAARIKAVAADRTVSPDAVRAVETELGTAIFGGRERVMVVFDADAQLESLGRKTLAELLVRTMREAVADYRLARTRDALLRSAAYAAVATVLLAALVTLVVWVSRWAERVLEATYRQRVQSVGIQSFQLVRAEQIWVALHRGVVVARALVILGLAFVYLQYVLGVFPWTRGFSSQLLGLVLNPLATMGWGIVTVVPDLFFLTILFFITRYLLKIISMFFAAVGRGEVALSGFEQEWADPTYKLLRVAVIALALVVAYPYIPGSSSDAFKGISIFIGIVFSLGSSSTIANIIAGYTMTYRRAFRMGDRVKISGVTGDVIEMRLQVTHLRTIKNEEVIIPNSTILNNEVVNYSSLARTRGLILHTTVGIGYETPWRQVEAMLFLAADRTAEIKREPAPFVRQLALGDFAVTYEINVYCDNVQAMGRIHTALHENILDVFNEHGVQIMTPAYEGDPEEPKVVPKEQWFTAPARPAGADGGKPQ